MDVFITYLVPVLVGIAVGVLSGMLGIGGGTILVPLFRLGFGMSPLASTATSLFTIIPTSLSGAIAHIRHKTCMPALGIALGLGGALTSPLGVWLAHLSPAWVVMLAAAIVIGYSAINMLTSAFKMKKTTPTANCTVEPASASAANPAPTAKTAPSAKPTSDHTPLCAAAPNTRENSLDEATLQPSFTPTRKNLALGVGIGLLAGVASGYVGLGGGFIMVPLMISVLKIPMKLTSGTSLIAVILLSISATIEQGFLGNINYTAGLAIALGSIPGALVGARLVQVVPERMLRLIFGCFLIVGAVLLVVGELGMLG